MLNEQFSDISTIGAISALAFCAKAVPCEWMLGFNDLLNLKECVVYIADCKENRMPQLKIKST